MKYLAILIPALLFLFSCNRPDIGPGVEETFFVRTDGADMPVYVRGNTQSNKFILVIHGGPGGQSFVYQSGKFAEILEEDHALLMWDQRGQGASQGHYGEDEVNIERMRLDLKAVVLAIKERYGESSKLYLMGHSWGGLLGTAFAQSEDQSLVDGWIEVGGAHDVPLLYESVYTMLDTFADREIAAFRNRSFWIDVKNDLATVPSENAVLENWEVVNRSGHQAERKISAVQTPVLRDEDSRTSTFQNPIDDLTSLLSGAVTANLLLEEVFATNLSTTMDQIQVPTLLLWGRYDFVVSPRLGEVAFPEIGTTDKEFVIFEQSGHSPMFNQPEEFSAVVADWISRH